MSVFTMWVGVRDGLGNLRFFQKIFLQYDNHYGLQLRMRRLKVIRVRTS